MLREKLRKDWAELKNFSGSSESKAINAKLKFSMLLLLLALIGVGLVSIKRELPPELRGQLHASGRVASCDIHSLNKRSTQFFVGITLDDAHAPMIRANPELTELSAWQQLCKRKPTVDVYFHAQKLLFSDTYFWLDRYDEHR